MSSIRLAQLLCLSFFAVFLFLNLKKRGTPAIQDLLTTGSFIEIDSNISLDQPHGLKVDSAIKYFRDSTGDLSFEEIRHKRDEFTPRLSDFPVKTFGREFWIRLEIRNNALSSKWYLGNKSSETRYYYSNDHGPWISGKVGTHVINNSDLFHIVSNPFISIECTSYSSTELYAKMSPGRLTISGNDNLWRFRNVLANKLFIYRFQIDRLQRILPITFILFTVFLYHIVIYLVNRERTYLLLGLAALSSLVLLIDDNYFIVQYFDIRNVGLFADYSFIPKYAFIAISIPFAISYLQLPKYSKTSQILKFCFYLAMVSFSLLFFINLFMKHFFENHQQIVRWYILFLLQLGNVALVAAGIIEYFNRNPNAPYFLLGSGTVFVGYIVTVIHGMGYIYLENHNLPIAVGYLFFSFGLAHQIKLNHESKVKAEKQKILSEQLHVAEEKETKRLKELDHLKSQLYTNITHEFRTPITVISGIADQITGNEEEKAMIQRSATNLLDLVNQMLDLSKIDAGHFKPSVVHADIVPQIIYLSETYRHLITSQHKVWVFDISHDAIWMDIDPAILERVLNNLVHNATKFTPRDGSIEMRVAVNARNCIIHLQDSGRGIPYDQLEKIFDRFYQIDATTTRQGEGTGIGLALVKELVTILDGSISATSEVGRGSTFTVCLPIRNNAPILPWKPSQNLTQPIIPAANDSSQSVEHHQNKILIVEDHGDVQRYLRKLLDPNFIVLEAGSGKQGLSIAFDKIPDLIISDVMMPEMDGIQLCQRIKSDPRTSHIPVILLTAKSTQDDKLEGLRGGADAFLVKPFDKAELFVRIEKLLENRQVMRRHYQVHHMLPIQEVQENRFLTRVREEIEKNLANEQYQIEDLASTLLLSRTQVFRKLKALTGKTYTQIARDMKIHRAKKLLRKTDLTVAEIAFELGFRDASYFSKVFKDMEGASPNAFRNQAQ